MLQLILLACTWNDTHTSMGRCWLKVPNILCTITQYTILLNKTIFVSQRVFTAGRNWELLILCLLVCSSVCSSARASVSPFLSSGRWELNGRCVLFKVKRCSCAFPLRNKLSAENRSLRTMNIWMALLLASVHQSLITLFMCSTDHKMSYNVFKGWEL